MVQCDEPLSNFAFNFNLRRYTTGGDDYTLEDEEVKMAMNSLDANGWAVTVYSWCTCIQHRGTRA